jgi:hypothetical protein
MGSHDWPNQGAYTLKESGVDPGVDPTQTPGRQSPLLPPPLAQPDTAEPSTMIAQMPIASGTFVMMFASPLPRQPRPG